MPFIDWPADDGSDDRAWLRAIRDGGLVVTDYDHLIHDAGGDSPDALATPASVSRSFHDNGDNDA